MDWNTASWAILLIGVAEVAEVSWCYGCNRFLDNVAEMGMRFGKFLRGYWWLSWVVLAPLTCLVSVSYLPSQHLHRGSILSLLAKFASAMRDILAWGFPSNLPSISIYQVSQNHTHVYTAPRGNLLQIAQVHQPLL